MEQVRRGARRWQLASVLASCGPGSVAQEAFRPPWGSHMLRFAGLWVLGCKWLLLHPQRSSAWRMVSNDSCVRKRRGL